MHRDYRINHHAYPVATPRVGGSPVSKGQGCSPSRLKITDFGLTKGETQEFLALKVSFTVAIEIMVALTCLLLQSGIFWVQIRKLEPRPDWSPLGV